MTNFLKEVYLNWEIKLLHYEQASLTHIWSTMLDLVQTWSNHFYICHKKLTWNGHKTVTTVKHIYGNNNIFPHILFHGCNFNCSLILYAKWNESTTSSKEAYRLRASLHGGGGHQIGGVTCGGSPHLSRKCDHIKVRDYIIWTGGLPRLPGVPHLHVNRLLNWEVECRLPPTPHSTPMVLISL